MQLKTNADDLYIWEKMKEKEHSFSKNLSDLSTDQLKNLCDSINKLFVVILKTPLQSEIQMQNEKVSVYAADLC